MIDRAGYRPFEARRRVVIIDEADAMLAPAQSALLKTLEEPPSASIFILVSSLPDSLLPTVSSRCPRLRFGMLSAPDVAAALMRDHGYDEGDARAASVDAEGSIGRALSARSLDLVEARETAQRLLEQAAQTADPVRRLDAVKNLTGGKGGPAGERDRLAVCLRALSSAGGPHFRLHPADARSAGAYARGRRCRARGHRTADGVLVAVVATPATTKCTAIPGSSFPTPNRSGASRAGTSSTAR